MQIKGLTSRDPGCHQIIPNDEDFHLTNPTRFPVYAQSDKTCSAEGLYPNFGFERKKGYIGAAGTFLRGSTDSQQNIRPQSKSFPGNERKFSPSIIRLPLT